MLRQGKEFRLVGNLDFGESSHVSACPGRARHLAQLRILLQFIHLCVRMPGQGEAFSLVWDLDFIVRTERNRVETQCVFTGSFVAVNCVFKLTFVCAATPCILINNWGSSDLAREQIIK